MTADIPDHFCPACGTILKPFLRYPWHFCRDCVALAVDGTGRPLKFGNTALSGGFAWRYADEAPEAARECLGVVCLIGGRPVTVREARFGGVVAEPAISPPGIPSGYWRLTGKNPVAPEKPAPGGRGR